MVFRYKASNGKCYYLNQTTSPKNEMPIRYFSHKANKKKGISLPDGFKVIESPRTGMPILIRATTTACLDCGKSFEQRRGNQKRCKPCQVKHRRKVSNENAKKYYTREQEKKHKKTRSKTPKTKKPPTKKHAKKAVKRTIKKCVKQTNSVKKVLKTKKKRGKRDK